MSILRRRGLPPSWLPGSAVRAYSVTPDAIERVASGTSQARRIQHRRG